MKEYGKLKIEIVLTAEEVIRTSGWTLAKQDFFNDDWREGGNAQ